MSRERIIVLKFGGSVLKKQNDVHRVVQEIYRWRRRGYMIVAVVSAIGDTTDQLTDLTKGFGENIDAHKSAQLLATGELQSASLLGLALDRAGINSAVGNPASMGLKTTGPVLDATLTEVDTVRLADQLRQHGVVVLPGFIGRGKGDELTLLGRGGSDLTALFIASRLDADRCRLIKDVDGLYEYDPKKDAVPPRRYRRLNYEDALNLDESIVQHKAIRFARDQQRSFEVTGLSAKRFTEVGAFPESDLTNTTFSVSQDKPERIRVALLGLGTVGFGVYQQIVEHFADQFEVVAVAVNDSHKAMRNGIPQALISANSEDAINSDCDVVIELVGGEQDPYRWIELAFRQHKHVVTANKSLLARRIAGLEKLAVENRVRFRWSAAVGGSVPVLETLESLAKREDIVEVTGVLNGSTNFVLELAKEGSTFEQAIERASELGLTERNAHLDIGGMDAAEKIVLIARECGCEIDADSVVRQELTREIVDDFDWSSGKSLRQIGRLTIHDGVARASVSVLAIPVDSIYAGVKGTGNLVEIVTEGGNRTLLGGIGAGRWPTTVSVIGDLMFLAGCLKTGDVVENTV